MEKDYIFELERIIKFINKRRRHTKNVLQKGFNFLI